MQNRIAVFCISVLALLTTVQATAQTSPVDRYVFPLDVQFDPAIAPVVRAIHADTVGSCRAGDLGVSIDRITHVASSLSVRPGGVAVDHSRFGLRPDG